MIYRFLNWVHFNEAYDDLLNLLRCLQRYFNSVNHQNCEILVMILPQSVGAAYKRGSTFLKRVKKLNPKSVGAAYTWVQLIHGISTVHVTRQANAYPRPL